MGRGGGDARRVLPSAAREAEAGMAGAVGFRLGPWMTMACEYDTRVDFMAKCSDWALSPDISRPKCTLQ